MAPNQNTPFNNNMPIRNLGVSFGKVTTVGEILAAQASGDARNHPAAAPMEPQLIEPSIMDIYNHAMAMLDQADKEPAKPFFGPERPPHMRDQKGGDGAAGKGGQK
ncbi:hypothetical protein B9Z65_945 [Elsinoe australis]|uniref:Uncharacterized protein n=1 Tax=Elsinoe australis TaxID=40998 RepID=A0A2P8AJZ7_9PEZI|nr:hypothetical protein B9Z65_945 [Elsinoe australis]